MNVHSGKYVIQKFHKWILEFLTELYCYHIVHSNIHPLGWIQKMSINEEY